MAVGTVVGAAKGGADSWGKGVVVGSEGSAVLVSFSVVEAVTGMGKSGTDDDDCRRTRCHD